MSELTEFLETIYGANDGYVYAATKETSGAFEQVYFGWPTQQDALVRYVQEKSSGTDVYVCPSLFRTASGQRNDVLGSQVVWADFDGNTPNDFGNLPEPQLVVETSKGHHHCYWFLESFQEPAVVENINRRIAYTLDADLSGWDANQLLRPPDTKNYKRDGQPVRVAYFREAKLQPTDFGTVPEPPALLDEQSFGDIPPVEDVIAKYPIPFDLWKKFKSGAEKPNRSTALAALGYSFAELGMTNEEIMAMLLNAASRMGKFEKRDARRLLADLITKIRVKVPFLEAGEEDLDAAAYSPTQLLTVVQQIEWVMKPYYHAGSLAILTGPPGIGKSQLALSLQQSFGLGTEWLENPISRPLRVGFLSLEMPPEELQPFLQSQLSVYDHNARSQLDKQIVYFPLGVPINLGGSHAQNYVQRLVEENHLDGLIIDSLSSCTPNELSSDKESKAILDFDVYLRKRFGIFTTYIHHNRKAQSDNKRPNKLSDVFGSGMMIIRPSMITTLWQEGTGRIEFKPLKMRLGALPEPFHISRTQELHFSKKAPLQGLTITKGGEEVHKVDVIEKEEGGGGIVIGSKQVSF